MDSGDFGENNRDVYRPPAAVDRLLLVMQSGQIESISRVDHGSHM